MKIFVTGDNHIGRKYAGHPKREEIISERISALSRMAEAANAEDCGLFAVTGDLFDNVNNVAKKHVEAVAEALSVFGGTVAVIPGNHDYFDGSAKVWNDFLSACADKDNIVLMTEYKPYKFDIGNDEAVIYPAFCDKPHSEPGENRLGWMRGEDFPTDGKICIGMAHGAVEGESLDSEGAYFMMKRSELNEIPADVWLIGHTHVPFPAGIGEEFAETAERVFNAGTHVQTDVSNAAEGACFILEVEKGKKIRAKKYVSGGLRFYRRSVTVSAGNMERELTEALGGFGDNSVVELMLSGAVADSEYFERREIICRAGERFLEFTYSDYGLTRLITKELVEKEFPKTSLAAGLLLGLLDDPKEAQLAYDLICEIKEGK